MAAKGYVYVVHPEGHNAYKIGCTIQPEVRLAQMQRRLDCKLVYAAVIPCDDQYRLESQLQMRFSRKALSGDWFALSLADVEYIKGLAS